ncbi:hypothetical protein [Streptomyces sp. DSM 15324]|uniref:hypothetical protein n=1 Tax=Streptomyces sp. DSM 15324 TaxID=1739111 RepID=UPI000A73B5B0|nr:hypothetical protein [Streptomyces sp. DSM 15324]
MSAPLRPGIPPVPAGLFDDAAVFPPGGLPIEEAVPAPVEHTRGAHAGLAGAFVLAAGDVDRLAELTADRPEGSFALSVTVPPPGVSDAVAEPAAGSAGLGLPPAATTAQLTEVSA